MLYLNQLNYRHIPYMHDLDNGGAPPARRNVATSGCGLCSLCMVVDHLTTEHLELEACVRLSEQNGANRKAGCSLLILGPIVAKLYGLTYSTANTAEELAAHLRSGGEAIVHVRADENGFGLFTYRGHYMVAVSTDGDEVCLLDPNYSPAKYREPGREGCVRISEPFVYCSMETLLREARTDPKFYLFRRESDTAR